MTLPVVDARAPFALSVGNEALAEAAARLEAKQAEEAQAAADAAAAAAAAASAPWAVSASDKAKFDKIFAQMAPEDGLVSGAKVAPVLKRSDLTNEMLRDVWNLVDVSKDGSTRTPGGRTAAPLSCLEPLLPS